MFNTLAFAQDIKIKIDHIRTVFAAINSDASLKKVVIDNDKLSTIDPDYKASDGGEELTGYFKDGDLVKLTFSVELSFGIKTLEFYFQNAEVIFAYEKQQNFRKNGKTTESDYSHLTTGFEGRYYLDKNKVIQKVEKGSPIGDRYEATILLESGFPKYRKILIEAFSGK